MNGKHPALGTREQIASRHSILARPGWEVLPWDFYHFQAHPAAGQLLLTFFQSPKGQGGVTARDTNFPGAGSLPSGQEFFADEIQIGFLPGVNPGTFGAQQAGSFVNDLWAVGRDGWLEFNIGSKKIVQEGPLGNFPPDFRMAGFAAAADATTAGAALQTLVNYASWAGRPRRLNSVLLEATVNFDITMNWNAAVALPSGVAGRIGVVLKGMLRRKLQ